MATVLRDKPFYDRSGGGVTLSGGEPFMNPTLAQALFEASHQAGIHTAVETCLHVPWKYIEPSLPFVDLFLADLKHVDEAVFQQWTDGSARRVLDNLQRLALAGKNDYSRAVDPVDSTPAKPTLPRSPILPPTACRSARSITCRTTRWE